MNQLAGYKAGDKVEVRTNVVYAGTPETGVPFETWETGTVIAEGFTDVNAYGDEDQQRIIVKSEGGTHIRAGSQLR